MLMDRKWNIIIEAFNLNELIWFSDSLSHCVDSIAFELLIRLRRTRTLRLPHPMSVYKLSLEAEFHLVL